MTWQLVVLVGLFGAVSCSKEPEPSVHSQDAAAKSDAAQTGTGGAAGASNGKGGAAGNATGGSKTASGGTTGSGGVPGDAAGTSLATGGSASGGSRSDAGGSAGATGNDGSARDVVPDLRTADTPSTDAPAERAARDTARSDTADSACPTGQTLCNSACVDTNSSVSNCGGCGTACGTDQVCSMGSCAGATANDGCSSDLASNLTLQQIAVYQTVKVPIMDSGAEVAASARNAGVVNGRQSLVRVFVTPGSGWTTRDLAARLTLVSSSAQPTVYSSKKTISAASTDADQKSTFQFTIPAESMTTDLAYSLEVVECSSTSGTAGQARFPASGTLSMGVRTTGVLKVKIIPLEYNSLLPDTSDTALATYAAEMKAVYPITDITFSVGDTLSVTSVSDWSGMLDQVRAKRTSDKPANDIYYFGLLKPAADLRTYCRSSCVTGIGFVVDTPTGTSASSYRAAMGIGFGDKASTETMIHEIGHNHGRNHVNCTTAGTITGIDNNYPYSTKTTGVWGYDSRTQTLLDPAKYVDMMSYCTPVWISDYNYNALVVRVAAVDGVANVLSLNVDVATWRVLLLDDRGPRWGIPFSEPTPAEGKPESATVYDGAGAALTQVTVYRTEISDIGAAVYMVPEPKDDWYAIAVDGAVPLPFAAPAPSL